MIYIAIYTKGEKEVFSDDFMENGRKPPITILKNLIVVTNNTREFCRVEGLALEDWTKED